MNQEINNSNEKNDNIVDSNELAISASAPNETIPDKPNKKPKHALKILLIIGFILITAGCVTAFCLYNPRMNQPIKEGAESIQTTPEVELATSERVVFDEQETTNSIDTVSHEGLKRSYRTINHKIYAVDLKGNKRLIYQFVENEENGSRPWIYVLKNQKIYISNPNVDNDYILLDKDGNDITNINDLYLKDDSFSIYHFLSFSDNNQIAYYKGEPKNPKKDIYIKDVKTNTEYAIPILTSLEYSFETMGGLSPVGWSGNDDSFMYVIFTGYEGAQYSKLWRVNVGTKEVVKINSADNISTIGLTLFSALDMALGVEGELFSDPGMGSGIDAPTKLFLIDIKNDTKKQIATSESNVIINAYLSEDGTKVLYQERESSKDYQQNVFGTQKPAKPKILSTKILDLSTDTTQDMAINKQIYFCSKDLKTVLLGDNESYYDDIGSTNLFDIESNKTILDLKVSVTDSQNQGVGHKYSDYIGYFN